MAEVAINLKGQDNLSKTVQDAAKNIKDLEYKATELGKASKQFDQITNSGKNLKTQLRQIQALMAEMNMKGLSNTDEFTQMAAAAGQIKDAINDASDAVKRFSSDTAGLDATIQAVQGITAAATVATGAFGLFGKESKEVQQAILKVQSALAILNGVQQIANVLNKDSALMQRIQVIRLAATTTATNANTAAVVANTAAERAWNTAKAIGKALLGDWSGLLLVGIAGITTYALATSKSTDEIEKNNQALEEAKKKQEEWKKTLQDTANSVITPLTQKYMILQAEWNKLKTNSEKTQWIKENANAFKELGFAVSSISDAENVLIANEKNVLRTIELRARAAVLMKQIEKDLEDGVKTNDQIDNTTIGGNTYSIGYATAKGRISDLANVNRELNELYNKYGNQGGGSIKTPSPTTKDIKYVVGSLSELEEKLNKLQKDYKDGFLKIDKNAYITQVNKLKQDIENKKIELGLTIEKKTEKEFEDGSIAAIKEKIKELKNELENKKLDVPARIRLNDKIDQLQREVDRLTKGKISIETEITPTYIHSELKDNLRQSYTNAQTAINKIKDDFQHGITKSRKEAVSAIQEMNGKLKDLGVKPIYIHIESNFEKWLKTIKEGFGGLDSVVKTTDSIISLTKAIEDGKNGWEIFKASVSTAESVLSSFQTVMTTVNTIQELFNVVKAKSAVTMAEEATATTAAATTQQAKAAADTEAATTAIAATTALKAQESAYLDMAAAAIFAAHAYIPFAGVGIATGFITSMMAAMAAQQAASKALQAFADGGIVAGNSRMKEFPILAHTGEMVLNERQQQRMFNILDGKDTFGNSSSSYGQIEWKLKGADLYGSMKNYSKIAAKTGKITGIK